MQFKSEDVRDAILLVVCLLVLLVPLSFSRAGKQTLVPPVVVEQIKPLAPIKVVLPKPLTKQQKIYLATITEQYRVNKDMVSEVLRHVDKHANKEFPRREDLLAIIGIESSWNPNAKSRLKKDPAIGLTQIRPITWSKLISSPSELMHIENQIKYAAKILRINFKLTGDKDAAIIAYNVGYGSWLDGKYEFDYLIKFKEELGLYGAA